MKKPYKHLYLIVLISSTVFLVSCDDNTMSSTSPDNPSKSGPFSGEGFGVSGLLFENNLIMWFRGNDGQRSELFPQMYGVRADVSDFPVWDQFPENQVVSGGVPRDGIPALTTPSFDKSGASGLSYLSEDDLILGVVINGESRAYPENILWWHEIVNDVLGGEKIIVSFCPLTGTGIVFRMPESPNSVDRLEMLPVIETTWQKWQELYPGTTALTSDTGFSRDYTRYPYGSYRVENTQPLFPLRTRQTTDTRFLPKHTVLGLIVSGEAKAYPFATLESSSVINDSFNGKDILVVSDLDARLAIPFDRNLNGELLTFERTSSEQFEMQDRETGSSWNILGVAVSGPLAGEKLRQIPAYNAFWFAWSTFWPSTAVLN